MTERKDADKETLWCSVLKYRQFCSHTVKWLYEGKDVDKDNKDMKTWQADCYAAVSFLDSHFSYKSKSNLKCEVTDGDSGKVQLFTFSPQSSGEKTGDAQTTTTTTTTENTKSVTATTTTNETSIKLQGLLVKVFLGVAALLITVVIVVALIRWKKTKGKKPQMDENTGRSLNPAVSPESSQDTADPEDGVSYASISYTRKTNSKGRVLGKDGDDEDDAVTYSSVKASFSADPSDLYATVNKPNK
ncbi:uncharacterized protein LOC123978362 [Micropterus dolomieu]|uniref:uncharacterized protein LOC123978362 n=1 Tax=Micropterus dolomieu TaxID=147949 RepID=UPI001E8D9332|nr:uncharacterized protein LOC123978362 [Micropterus dolomieu]